MQENVCSRNLTESKPSLVALRKWTKEIGISTVTAWRWAKFGRIHPINIAGKLYLSAYDLEQFERRAKDGEFAKRPQGAAGTFRKDGAV
jgi:hypothetical protein